MYFTISDFISIFSIIVNFALVWFLSIKIVNRQNNSNSSKAYISAEITKFYDSFNNFCLSELQTLQSPIFLKNKLDSFFEHSNMIDSYISTSFSHISPPRLSDYVVSVYNQIDLDLNFIANFRANANMTILPITKQQINTIVSIDGCKHIQIINEIINR